MAASGLLHKRGHRKAHAIRQSSPRFRVLEIPVFGMEGAAKQQAQQEGFQHDWESDRISKAKSRSVKQDYTDYTPATHDPGSRWLLCSMFVSYWDLQMLQTLAWNDGVGIHVLVATA